MRKFVGVDNTLHVSIRRREQRIKSEMKPECIVDSVRSSSEQWF